MSANPTFQADALWGWRYVLPPDRILDARGIDITGFVPNGTITRVVSSAACWLPRSDLSADAVPMPLSLMPGYGSVFAAASTSFSVPWSGASELAADGSVVTP